MGKKLLWATLLTTPFLMAYCIYYVWQSSIPLVPKVLIVLVIAVWGIGEMADIYEDIWYLDGLEKRR